MKLTKRQREILEGLASDDSNLDLIEDSGVVYFGLERTNVQMVMFLLRHALVSSDNLGGCTRYEINEWGRHALREPDFEPLLEIAKLRARAELAERACNG